MIVLKLFSRHTPKGLKKYADREKLDKLSESQKLDAVEDEYETASKNTTKYIGKKLKKHVPAGAIGGAALGAALSKGSRGQGAFGGAVLGSMTGLISGSARGAHFASKEGHDPEKKARSLGRYLDEKARKEGRADIYERAAKNYAKEKRNEATQRAIARNTAITAINTW